MLVAQHQLGVTLRGIIYLQQITDNKFRGSSGDTLRLFKDICGEETFRNVMLVTTRWDGTPRELGLARERELAEDFWQDMTAHGATMSRFYGDKSSAMVLASQLVSRPSIVLQLQKELVMEGKLLSHTTAGAILSDAVEKRRARVQSDIDSLAEQRRQENISDRKRKQLEREQDRRVKELRQALKQEEKLRQDLKKEVDELLKDKREAAERLSKEKKRRWGNAAVSIALKVIPAIALELIGMFIGIPGMSGGLVSTN